MIACWPCPRPQGGTAEEYAFAFDRGRSRRLLIVPALFDEANRLRRFTVETMRRLDAAGIDSFLPDLPGCNESLAAQEEQTPATWRAAMAAAAAHFGATHVLAIRGGAIVAPAELPGWLYAPTTGASVLRQMLRARILAAREVGRDERQDALLEQGRREGLELAGHLLGPAFVVEFESSLPPASPALAPIDLDGVGGSPLWLRAEPGDDPAQADALAARIVAGIEA